MTRSKWKPPFIDSSLLKKLNAEHENKSTWSRRSTIYPAAIGLHLPIHNGKEMLIREIKPQMIGHKLGEFVSTRKNFITTHKGKGGKKKNK